MENLARTFLTEEEYLKQERNAPFKSEYYKGEIFAMAGARRKHNAIVTALIASLYPFLKDRPCEVYSILSIKYSPIFLSRNSAPTK
jgi:Uma2 family endonuclease